MRCKATVVMTIGIVFGCYKKNTKGGNNASLF